MRRWISAGLSLCLWLACLEARPATHGRAPAAGPRYTIDVWENDDDLPQNSVICMLQTRDGYLWLGTLNGLVRFDGRRITVYDEYNTPGLSSSPISALFEDSRGDLWIGSDGGGVARVRDGHVINLGIGRGTREQRLAAMAEDAAGVLWFYTQEGYLWRLEEGRTNLFRLGIEYPSHRRALIAEKDGPLWAGMDLLQTTVNVTDFSGPEPLRGLVAPVTNRLDFLLASRSGGYWRLADGQIQKWRSNQLDRVVGTYPWSPATHVTSACEDREGNLLIGTLGDGVWWIDAGGATNRLSADDGLSNNFILSLLVDREGTLWVGTDGGGLCRVKRQLFDTLEQTRGLAVQSVAESTNSLWVGFNNIGTGAFGVAQFVNGTWDRYGPYRGLPDSSVRSVFVDREQNVWAGAVTYGLLRKQGERFELVNVPRPGRAAVFASHQDRSGQLWFGTQRGLDSWDGRQWRLYSRSNGLSADEVRAIADDAAGNLWVGTRGGGLNRLRDGQWTAFHRQDGLPSEDVSALHVDREGALWVGTFGSGAARLRDGQWTRYSISTGLVGNGIGYFLEDDAGYLWIGSNRGLMRMKIRGDDVGTADAGSSFPVRVFGRTDGMPTRECASGSQPAACKARDGRLWFPTTKGLVSLHPSKLQLNTNPPPVVIESVIIDGQPQTSGLRARVPRSVTLPAARERLEIEFSSLNLSEADRTRFRYRLDGHESDWTFTTGSRVAVYRKLPPGEYRFRVTAANEDGIWNPTGSFLDVVVLPPFWRTWWFLTIVTCTVLGLVAGAVYYVSTQRLQRQLAGLRQQEALEKERARIARDIHDQLGANLTQVSLLGELIESDKEHPDEVATHARQISQTALETSRALDEIVWTVNPQNDTLDGLINYICKHAQEYLTVAGLRCRLEIPSELPNVPITPEIRHNTFLVARESVTNIVRHAQAASVWLRLKLEPQRFILEIQDDGRGPGGINEPRAQTRNGLRNMRRRMEDIGGAFHIGPAPERGTLVRLTVPVPARSAKR